LLWSSHRDELVPDSLLLKKLLKRVGLLHMGQEDIGELNSMVSLHLLDGEGEESHHCPGKGHRISRAELFIGLDEAESGAVINGRVLIFLVGLWPPLQANLGHVFDIHLYPLSRVVHLVVHRLLTRTMLSGLDFTGSHQHLINPVDAELDLVVPFEIES
jgi:hypothetical protein